MIPNAPDTQKALDSRQLTRLLRFGIAFVISFYGFAKLTHAQFTILDNQLDLPLKQVSGFWLTWYYFGYSALYGTAIALAQLAPAVLLLFRRTALLGALLLLPVLANIVLVDISFGIDPAGATIVAILLLCADLLLLWGERGRLQVLLLPGARPAERPRIGAWALRCAVLLLPLGVAYWTANYNNRQPTPIDGAWQVVHADVDGTPLQKTRWIYFEYNRAWMCVLRDTDGHSTQCEFHVDPQQHTLRIQDGWMKHGTRLLDGVYQRQGDHLTLTGQVPERSAPVLLELEREPMPVQDHVESGS